MKPLASLRRELIIGLALLLLASLGLAAVAILLWLPIGASVSQVLLFLAILIALDVGVFVIFGDYLLRQMVLRPVTTIVEGAEAIAASGRLRWQ